MLSFLRVLPLFFVLSPLRASIEASDGLLERARVALGGPARAEWLLRGSGTSHSLGTDGSVRVAFGADGAFRVEIDSALPTGFGFDGKGSWLRDMTGVTRTAELEEADRAKVFAWVLSGHWTEAPALEITEYGAVQGLSLVLRGTPMRMRLELDPKRSLPRALRQDSDGGLKEWIFEDYREVDGRPLAHAWTFDEGAGLEHFQIESWTKVDRAPEFRLEPSVPHDFAFDLAAPPELVVERSPSGHLVVEARLEGEDFGAFLFDTGAGALVLDKRVADELGLATLGETIAVGVAGTTTSGFRRGASFTIGPMALEDPVFGDLDLGFLQPHFKRRIAGIVGYDVLARCVVELEPGTPRIALYPSDTYPDTGSWSDLVLHGNHTCVPARFEGNHEGLFRLDTGAGGTATFHAPAVDALDLLSGRKLQDSRSGGVGGSAGAFFGTLAWFELGGHRFESPEVEFSRTTQGAFADLYTTGNVGQEFLSPLRIVLDYPRDRLRLAPLER